MNIIYLHCHDMGRLNGVYEAGLRSPNLVRFADDSVVFGQAYCAAPTCSPSRAALLTGMTAHESGMLGLTHRGFALGEPRRHLAAFLGRKGYHTMLAGVQHEMAPGEARALYDVSALLEEGEDPERDELTAERAVAMLRENRNEPFFLNVGLFLPHRDFIPASAAESSVPNLPGFPETDRVRRDLADYQASLEVADAAFGRVLNAIYEQGLEERSVIILTTDHGAAFPRCKCSLRDAGIGVTLMIRVPGRPRGRRNRGALVSHLDVFPTLCDYAGLDLPAWLQGHSLRPVIENDAAAVREEIFAEVTYHASYEPMRCIRTDRYKYIRFFDADRRQRLANIDDGPAKEEYVSAGLNAPGHPEVQLYDLSRDPAEMINLAGRAELVRVEKDLDLRLTQWMRATKDPLLAGPVPAPPQALVDSISCRSAKTARRAQAGAV